MLLICPLGIIVVTTTLTVASGRVKAAASLHKALLLNILRSPGHFFDITPLGRVLNRFTKDVDMLDMVIPMTLSMTVMTVLQVIGIVGVIAFGTPIFLAIIVPVGVVYFLIQV